MMHRWIAVLGFVLFTGCGEAPEAFVFPQGAVASEAPLWVAPDRDWGWTEQRSLWLFRGSARLLFVVGGTREPLPLTVHFRPTGEAAAYRFAAQWDGQPVVGEGGEEAAAMAGPDGEIAFTIPAERLTPGRHALGLRRVYQPGDAGHDNTFTTVAYTVGAERTELDLGTLLESRQVADFLDLGLAGEGHQKRGGLLFLGPGRRVLPVHLPKAGYLELTVENFAREVATFAVRIGGTRHALEVPPGGTRPLRIPLLAGAAGTQSLQLAVEGPAQGAYLWGAPYFEAADREAPDARERPPIVLITLDTTRRDALSPFNPALRQMGEGGGLTPHLEAFAQGATVYEQAYSTGPWTLPTHGSLMTGLYPSNHGAGVTEAFLPSRVPTLARILGHEGYWTVGFAGGKLASHTYGVGQGFALYRNPDSFETKGDRLTDYLVSFLDEHHRKDLFLFANYFDPHALYQAPLPFQQRVNLDAYRPALAGKPLWEAFDRGVNSAWGHIVDGVAAPIDEGIAAYMRAAYLAEVAFMDHQLGRLFDTLKQYGLYDRALILIVADHGEMLGEHGGVVSHAGRVDPELVEIPLLVKWPHQTAGERVPATVSQVDVMATVLGVVGLPVPEGLDGRPLPRAGDREAVADPRRVVILEEHESRVHPLPEHLRVAPHLYGVQRLLERQVVWKDGGECAARDTVDGAWVPAPCERASEALLARLEGELGEKAKVEAAGVLSKEQEEGLKALGYL